MTTLTISIIVVFVLGYALIATESLTKVNKAAICLLYTSPSPRDRQKSRMPSSA